MAGQVTFQAYGISETLICSYKASHSLSICSAKSTWLGFLVWPEPFSRELLVLPAIEQHQHHHPCNFTSFQLSKTELT